MNENGSHVDEFCCNIHVQFTKRLDISQVLRSDLRNGNIVDVDVLLADQVEQEIKRAFVDIRNSNCEREVALLSLYQSGIRRSCNGSRSLRRLSSWHELCRIRHRESIWLPARCWAPRNPETSS